MEGKGPACLTPALIKEVTGEEDLELIDDIEIIFNEVQFIGGLERCANLRSLSLIDTKLQCIDNLKCIGMSLEKLMLTEQQISKVEGLQLPNLRELYLQNNQISQLEGFEGCPKLQRLWLFSNRISKIENLHCLGDLRELWLQDNKISRVTGLENLVNLECLALASNRIADFKDLQRLAHLPALREVSFDDPDFGICPVARAEGYRHFVICSLKQLRVLDNVEVDDKDRSESEDVYMRKVLEFNDRVDEVRRQNERELLAIEARRQRNMANAEDLRRELQAAFGELETVVDKGRHRIAVEHQRQTRLRAANLRALEEEAEKLVQHHAQEVQRLVEAEQKRIELEEQWFEGEQRRVEAERDEAIFLATLQHARRRRQGGGAGIAGGHGGGEGEHGAQLRLFKVSKVHNAVLETQFEASTERLAAKGLLTTGGGVGTARDRLYIGGSRGYIRQVLQYGVTAAVGSGPDARIGDDGGTTTGDAHDASSPVVLFTDPACAVDAARDTGETAGIGAVHSLVMCRVALGRVHTLFGTRPTKESLSKRLPELLAQLPADCQAAQVNYGTGSDAGAYFFMSRRFAQHVLPVCFLLCQEIATTDIVPRASKDRGGGRGVNLDQLFGKGSEQLHSKELEDLERDVARRLEEQLQLYEERVWQELDPDTAERIRQAEAEAARYEEALEGLRQQIDNEKGLQESILRDFRSQSSRLSKTGVAHRSSSSLHSPSRGMPLKSSSRPGSAHIS